MPRSLIFSYLHRTLTSMQFGFISINCLCLSLSALESINNNNKFPKCTQGVDSHSSWLKRASAFNFLPFQKQQTPGLIECSPAYLQFSCTCYDTYRRRNIHFQIGKGSHFWYEQNSSRVGVIIPREITVFYGILTIINLNYIIIINYF